MSRATVYHWLATIPAFEKAVRDAAEKCEQEARKRWGQWAEEREQWRKEREQACRPMRCFYLTKARAALKEALCRRGGRKHRPWL